jgi:hypothetical protein
MSEIALVDNDLTKFDVGLRLNAGQITTIANNASTANQRVTKALVSTFLMQADSSAYNAGKTKRYIPVSADNAAFTNVITGVADKKIIGVVVAAGHPKAAVPYESDVYDIKEHTAEGEPIDVSVAFGKESIYICEYDGSTDPDPTTVGVARRVVLSGTPGKVKVASSLSIADAIGSEVIAVNTTLKLVAIRL